MSPTPNPIVSGIRRAEQVLFEQVGERTTLDFGIAFCDAAYPQSLEDNAFREVLISDASQMPAAWEAVESFYGVRQLTCQRWVPSLAQDSAVIEPFLLQQGWHKKTYLAMYVSDWPNLSVSDRVRVLPARAMRKAFLELHRDPQLAAIEHRRLDYAQFDVFVATLENRAAGLCGLLQAGEIGNIRKLSIAGPFRRQKVASTLMQHVLDMARRLMMKVVCLKVDSANLEGRAFLEHCGFRNEGQLLEFHRTP